MGLSSFAGPDDGENVTIFFCVFMHLFFTSGILLINVKLGSQVLFDVIDVALQLFFFKLFLQQRTLASNVSFALVKCIIVILFFGCIQWSFLDGVDIDSVAPVFILAKWMISQGWVSRLPTEFAVDVVLGLSMVNIGVRDCFFLFYGYIIKNS